MGGSYNLPCVVCAYPSLDESFVRSTTTTIIRLIISEAADTCAYITRLFLSRLTSKRVTKLTKPVNYSRCFSTTS